METNQRWVEECRKTDTAECGVMVPCPASNNPCGLGSDFTANMLGDANNCSTASRLVVNAALNDSVSCDDWTGHAFRHSDGYCVSACDNTADECVLNGTLVQPCVNGSHERGLCYVSMPVGEETGVRNAFYGLTKNDGFGCWIRVLPSCNVSSEFCFRHEGLSLGFFFPAYRLPVCNGNVSMDCYIRWPCFDGADEDGISDCGFLRISDAMYRGVRGGAMESSTCNWIRARDIITCVLLWLTCAATCVLFCEGDLTWVWGARMFVCIVLTFVWEAGLVLVCVAGYMTWSGWDKQLYHLLTTVEDSR